MNRNSFELSNFVIILVKDDDTMFEEILNSITEMGADRELVEMVLKRLSSFSYKVVENDVYSIYFSIKETVCHINNVCHTDVLEDKLKFHAANRACGIFLEEKKNTGQLEGFDIEQAMTSVKLGDTTVNFSTSDSESSKFATLVNALKNGGEGDLKCYRRIRFH